MLKQGLLKLQVSYNLLVKYPFTVCKTLILSNISSLMGKSRRVH